MAEPIDCSIVVAIKPGTGSPADIPAGRRNRPYVFRSLVRRTRFSAAVQARTSRSGTPTGKASWTRSKSISGRRRRRPGRYRRGHRRHGQSEHWRSPWRPAGASSSSRETRGRSASSFARKAPASSFSLLQGRPRHGAGDSRRSPRKRRPAPWCRRRDHVLRRHAVFILLDDQVEADATVADADGAPFVHPEREMFQRKGAVRLPSLPSVTSDQLLRLLSFYIILRDEKNQNE